MASIAARAATSLSAPKAARVSAARPALSVSRWVYAPSAAILIEF